MNTDIVVSATASQAAATCFRRLRRTAATSSESSDAVSAPPMQVSVTLYHRLADRDTVPFKELTGDAWTS